MAGWGDSVIKKRLEVVLQEILAPIRARREALAQDNGYVMQVLKDSTMEAREVAANGR